MIRSFDMNLSFKSMHFSQEFVSYVYEAFRCEFENFFQIIETITGNVFRTVSDIKQNTSRRLFLNFSPLMHNYPKWSDTLSKSCSICCKIFKSVSDHFGTLCITGLKLRINFVSLKSLQAVYLYL